MVDTRESIEMQKVRIANLFGDVDNGGASGYADYDNSVWQHVLNVPRVPLEKKLTDHQIGLWCKNMNIDVLLCTMWGTFVAGTGKAQRGVLTLKEVHPDLKVIGLADEPLMVDWAHRFGGDACSMRQAQGYADGLADFDAIITICNHEDAFYRAFNKNTYYLGLPFPDRGYRNLVCKERHPLLASMGEDKIWIGLGVGGNAFTRWERNYGVALAAFELAVKYVREVSPAKADAMRGLLLSWTEKSRSDVVVALKDRYPNVFIQMRSNMQEYLRYLQSCTAVINPCLRDTPGRLVGECAFFKVPCFGSRIPDLQEILYGKELIFEPFDVEGYAEAVSRCVLGGWDIEDEINTAHERLIGIHGMDASRENFRNMLMNLGWADNWFTVDEHQVIV